MKFNKKRHDHLDTMEQKRVGFFGAQVRKTNAFLKKLSLIIYNSLMKIKTEVEISEQLIEDLIVTAIEGGSNYWYCIGKTSFKDTRKDNSLFLPYSEYFAREILNNKGSARISDIENHDFLGTISKKSIEKGLKLMSKAQPQHFSDMISDNWDATTSDCFFQFAVMGEYIYG